MQVREIAAIRGAHFADLLAPLHDGAVWHEHLLHVGIDGFIDAPTRGRGGVRHAMGKDKHVSPAGTGHAGVDHLARAAGIDWIAQIRIPTADAVEIIAQMARGAERLRIVGQRAALAPHGWIESHRQGQRSDLPR